MNGPPRRHGNRRTWRPEPALQFAGPNGTSTPRRRDIAPSSIRRPPRWGEAVWDATPGTVFTAGDNVYDAGTDAEFQARYEPTWGTEKSRTRPSVGNHEHVTPGASGYFNYFGAADPARGIREFVVGTGGAGLRPFATVKANSQVRNADTHDVLKLTPDPTGYGWRFVPVAGKTFTDSGTADCH